MSRHIRENETVATGAIEEFQAERGRLFGLAYRMLGSAMDAEDVVQDTWLRWQQADHEGIVSTSAWLVKVATNQCLNRLTSAHTMREEYLGPWLPEPVLTSGDALGPLDRVEQRELVSLALLLLFERLTPAERAAFILREAFGYSHSDVADAIGVSEVNARQLHFRARGHVGGDSVRVANPIRWSELVERFLDAAQNGNLVALESLLSDDVVSWADGGGIVNAARNPIIGRARVARYLLGVLEKFAAGLVPEVAEFNGELALMAFRSEELAGVWFIGMRDKDHIGELRLVLNPEKLRFASVQLSHFRGLSGSNS